MLERHPPERANAASRRALHFGCLNYMGVKNILLKGLDLEPLDGEGDRSATGPAVRASRGTQPRPCWHSRRGSTMSMPTELVPVLKRLRLSGVLDTLDLRTREAVDEDLSHGEFLLRLCYGRGGAAGAEAARTCGFGGRTSTARSAWTTSSGSSTRRSRRRRSSTWPRATSWRATRACCCWARRAWARATWPRRWASGRAGRGTAPCTRRRTGCSRELRAARADRTYDKKLLRYTAPDLLIIDDLGLRPLDGDEPIDLYEIIRARYERGAMIVTSNRALEEWYPLFRDDLMASAAMDRLLHHAHVLTLEGDSFRNPPKGRRRA